MHIDQLDSKILAMLRDDGRASHAAIAGRLDVARATVKARVERMEAAGVIVGYSAQVSRPDDQGGVRAFTSLKISGHRTSKIVDQLLREPSISQISSTNGKWDLVVEIHAESNFQLDQALDAIRQNEGITESETSILLRRLR